MTMSRPARLFLLAILASAFGYILLLLAIPFLGLGWHLFHRSFIASNGCRIPVPKDFYVSGSVQQPTMWKYTLGVPLLKRPFGLIGIRPGPSGANFEIENDLENSSPRIIATAQGEGLTLRSTRTVESGMGKAFCFEFSEPIGKYGITVRCAIDGTPILMIYGGDDRFSAEFYWTVQRISRDGPKPSPNSP